MISPKVTLSGISIPYCDEANEMLGWRALSGTKRAYGIFLCIVMGLGGALSLWQAASFSDGMVLLGGILCAFGIILNPACFADSAGLPKTLAEMPRLCRVLVAAGLCAIISGTWLSA